MKLKVNEVEVEVEVNVFENIFLNDVSCVVDEVNFVLDMFDNDKRIETIDIVEDDYNGYKVLINKTMKVEFDY